MTQPLTPARQPLTPARQPPSPLAAVKQTLAANLRTVNALLAGYTTPERFMGGIVTAMQINEELQECAPQSVLLASLRVAQLRLSPDPALGQAYLIPRRVKVGENKWEQRAEFQLGYKGVLQLLYRSPLVRNVRYNVVRAGDRFRWVDGASWALEHEPGTQGWPTTWDELVAAWAIIELVNGGQIPRVMYADEIRRHKERGKGAQPAWQTDLGAMAAKTVLGDAARRGPLDGESLLGVNLDHQGEAGLPQQTADLEEMVAPQAAAERAAAAIVGKNRPTVQPAPPGSDLVPAVNAAGERLVTYDGTNVYEGAPEVTIDGRNTLRAPSTPPSPFDMPPNAAGERFITATPHPPGSGAEKAHRAEVAGVVVGAVGGATKADVKPWQHILDLKLPRVGDTIAARLLEAKIDTYERILEAGRFKLAEIPGISDLSATAMVLASEKALGGEPPAPKAASSEVEKQEPPTGRTTEPDPFEGMETRPLAPAAGEIPFPGQRPATGTRPPLDPPFRLSPGEQKPITFNEVYALQSHAKRTKRGGAPSGPEGDKAAVEAMEKWVEATFGMPLDKLPKGLFRVVFEWAEAPGIDPPPSALLVELREKGIAK